MQLLKTYWSLIEEKFQKRMDLFNDMKVVVKAVNKL